MNFFLIASLFVIASGAEVKVAVPTLGEQSMQFQSQDVLGQYAYGYADSRSAKNEIRYLDGQTVGAYSYVDPEGIIQNVQYRSDPLHGFQVSGTNMPVAPVVRNIPPLVVPKPVQDTPEVVEARTRHLETFRQIAEAAKASSAEVELKSTIKAAPVVPTVEFHSAEAVRAAIPAPAFSYSVGINHGFYQYTLAPKLVSTYFGTGQLLTAPILHQPALIADTGSETSEAAQSLPEIVAVRQAKDLKKE